MACIRPMTPVLFVGFGTGAWAVALTKARLENAAAAIGTRMKCLLGLFIFESENTRTRQPKTIERRSCTSRPDYRRGRRGHESRNLLQRGHGHQPEESLIHSWCPGVP